MRAISLISAVAILAAGCSGERIVTTDEPRVTIPTSTTPPPALPPPTPAHLVSAFDYVAHPQGSAVYYFSSPSGRWTCAILPRDRAGCQSSGGQSIGVTGAPDSVPDSDGEQVAPNAIVVDRDGDARFVAAEPDEFVLADAKELPFNRILAVAGFRCNVQEESGISCASERTGKGFSFAADAFVPRYTEVPPNAP
ncbi:hypothetical protein H7J88_05320 [Mycolicibacterium flavescens]|uniref:Lipoprotein n=1 Tax=Mycolicibacterium flavescens TaxID=1776 RepID=A0A1E3RMB9_MYCFV|nr:hypothetical protein [Mycolicibacterium flavescens]MCV7279064.1 hypothetical protein [Mycolicibacterium flavescens]ODQ90547.1 hypothetical protein BHQ18_11010 [Mycolicibacterium flavescens]